jgi:DNA repair protein RadA/Sms
MQKLKTVYTCNQCGASYPKWIGQCVDCQTWDSVIETQEPVGNASNKYMNYAGQQETVGIVELQAITSNEQIRISSGLDELDRVLGGGLVLGAVVLVGGDPGIGKSTILLQSMGLLSQKYTTLYVTGEESLQQVKLRAERLGLLDAAQPNTMQVLADTNLSNILQLARTNNTKIMVLDSIQTIYTPMLSSAPGSVGQLRDCTAELVQFAKTTQTILFVIGHVTKEGMIAGPRVLEHMVDTVLYFEGSVDSKFRILRAVKNRFGAVNELGVFAMTEKGLQQVNNPSSIFLSSVQQKIASPGTVVMVTWEGSRSLLVELQALVVDSYLTNPRRVVLGFESNRLALMLAVLARHGGKVPATYNKDIFVNIVGGLKINETAIDLAVVLAVYSSLQNKSLPKGLVVFGEIGLAGEIRPVQYGQERLREALKLGFTKAIIPKANAPKQALDGLEITLVQTVAEALAIW